jgi:hypothetical protein
MRVFGTVPESGPKLTLAGDLNVDLSCGRDSNHGMMRMLPCLLVVVFMATGCGWFSKGGPSKTTPPAPAASNTAPGTNDIGTKLIVTPDTTTTGTVARVNSAARFVILTFPVGSMPPVGQLLYVYRHGLKVGEVKVTAPQQDDNTAADIVTGEAALGDEIRMK